MDSVASLTIPLKTCSAKENYSQDEVKALTERWSDADIAEVASWLHTGAEPDERPACVSLVNAKGSGAEGYDLRGINLSDMITSEQVKNAPPIRLPNAHLEHANLSRICLHGAVLSGAHLQHASLVSTQLSAASLNSAHLQHAVMTGANMEGANFRWANLSRAQLGEVHMAEADLSYASLEKANLSAAHLERATAVEARLDQVFLRFAHLEHACLKGSSLRHADLSHAHIEYTDLSHVRVEDTIFQDVHWRPAHKLLKPWTWAHRPRAAHYVGFDNRGLRYSDPLFDQFVQQSTFIQKIRQTMPWVYWPWVITCNCGRSFSVCLGWCAVVISIFTVVFGWAHVSGHDLVAISGAPMAAVAETDAAAASDSAQPEGSRQWTPITPLYISVSTFSPLGSGGIVPLNETGESLVILELTFGYIFLGGLLSIFAMKLLPWR